jgi:hypothetical protein
VLCTGPPSPFPDMLTKTCSRLRDVATDFPLIRPIDITELHVLKPSRWTMADIGFVGIIWLAIIAGVFRKNAINALWFDELLAYQLISDPSLGHMLAALGDQVDGGGPVFYLLAHQWAQIFGLTELSLRLLSGICFCVGATVLWSMIRRNFPVWVCALAISCALGTSSIIRFEMANVRFYGLLFALVSVALLLAQTILSTERPRKSLLVANFLVHASMVLTHPFGLCYSGLITVGVAVADWAAHRRIRLKVLLSSAAAWLSVLLWLKQFIRQSDLNNPFTWVRQPSRFELFTSMNADGNYTVVALLIAAALVFRRRDTLRPETPPAAVGISMVAFSCLAIIPVFWMFSRLAPSHSIFLPRYFTGCVAAWVIILAALTGVVRDIPRAMKVGAIILSVLMLSPLTSRYKPSLKRADSDGVTERLYGETHLPILTLDCEVYLARHLYAQDSKRYFFALDWESIGNKESHYSPTVFKLMDALARNYPAHSNVVRIEDFLARETRFFLSPSNSRWAATRLPASEYDVKEVSSPESASPGSMLLVQKRAAMGRSSLTQ